MEKKDFIKVVRIGKGYSSGGRGYPIFCKIEFEAGKLSISGVEGPLKSGDCIGGCGQIDMSLRSKIDKIGLYRDGGWTRQMLEKFFDIWKEWHLNDMRSGCSHQRAEKWGEKDLVINKYKLARHISERQREIKNRVLHDVGNVLEAKITPEEQEILAIPCNIYYPAEPEYWKPSEESEDKNPLIKLRGIIKRFYVFDSKETKSSGWVYEKPNTTTFADEWHPEGVLCKPCPVCGYTYGSSWLSEEIPDDVYKWLRGLPDTPVTPAWV